MAKSLALNRHMADAGAADSEAKPAPPAKSTAAPTPDNTFQVNLFMSQLMLKALAGHAKRLALWTIPLKACDTFPLPPPIHLPGAMNSPRGAAFSANMLWLTPAVLAIGNGAGCGTPPVGSTAAVATPVIAVLLAFLALRA